ncbi:MAG TPA: hypothetical protein VKU02_21765 [Gemmataceae bacterium]|nr:hypothetical protein [Gemmataceae bacterium]
MNDLQPRLAALRRRLRLVVTFRGLALVLVIVLSAAVLTGLLDWRIPGHLPSLVRAILLAGTLALGGTVAYRSLLRPLWAHADDLSLALRVESRYPALNDSLASAVQFLEQPADSERGGSPSLRRKAVERALNLASGLDFHPVVDSRGVRAAGASLAGVSALAVGLILAYPQLAWTALYRLAHPFGGREWPRQTQLEITAGSRVAQGEVFEIRGRIRGLIPERARIVFRFEHGPPLEQDYEIQRVDGSQEGELLARLEASRVHHPFRFQARANDAVSSWYEVAVFPPPQLVPLAGRPSPQIHLHFPDYTDLHAVDLPDGTSSIEAAAGTAVHLRAAANRPLVRAWLEVPPELEPALTMAAFLQPLGAPRPAGALEWAAASQQAWRRIPARLESGGTVFTIDFIARVSGTFALHFEDEMGLRNTRLVEMHTLADPAPVSHLERPSLSRDSLDVLPDAEITLLAQVEDQRYAIRSVSLDYRHKPGGSTGAPGSAGRLLLYDHAALGAVLPQFLTAMTASPFVVPSQNVRLRPLRLEIGRRWSLRELNLREGDLLVIQVCADDFDDVTAGKKPGCSQEVELRVVGRAALETALDEAQAQIQQDLVRLHKQQQEAKALVIPAEVQQRTEQGPLPSKNLDELLQAEQLQQQIRARVGTDQEGLRAEVGRILQTIHDNQMPRSGTNDRMETVAAELNRLAREELSQIEPQLTEARKQSEVGAAKPFASKNPSPLSEARKHQEEAEKTFSELLELLEPWSSTREVKGEAKSILGEQRRLSERTAGLAQELPPSPDRDQLNPTQKAELERTEEAQRNLADRAGQLLQKLKRLAADRADRDPAMAKQLGEAASRGEESDAAGKMREAEQSIRKMQLARASKQQQGSVHGMEEVVKALEDRREQNLDRLAKKLREAEQQLGNLLEQQDRLRAKAKEAAQMADPRQRQEALKRLAREQEQLQRETQEMVRELSRLRAERASQALGEASSGMQRAGRQMDNGENSEELQEEMLDRLNEAQQKLREAREETEEQLAREKLAKLADQIKGLRERQETLLAESARIHRELLQRKQWVRPLQASLRSLAENQRGLSEEVQQIAKEKLQAAKVFAHLLNTSAGAMNEASDQMVERLDKARERIENTPFSQESALDVPAEQAADTATRNWQRAAARRMDRLLESLKPEPGMGQSSGGGGGGGEGSGGGGSGGSGSGGDASDRIAPLAQLKALRALQEEVNERTKTFDQQHPDREKLTKQDQDALQAIRQEQGEIADLFQQFRAPAEIEEDKK